VDLAGGRLVVRGTETDAAQRVVRLLPGLHAELREHAARSKSRGGRELVFGTGLGTAQTATNVRRRVLAPAISEANERLLRRGLDPLPDGLTPHSLRRTFASLHVALGTDPAASRGRWATPRRT
jgi:integrase